MMRDDFDVIVTGGGPAGIVAAMASARNGARTLLIEGSGFVGGVASMGLPIQGLFANNEERIVDGLPWRLMRRLIDMGHAADVRNVGEGPPRGRGSPKFNARWVSYHPEAFKFVALDELLSAGVTTLFHASIADVSMEGSALVGVVIDGKSGRTHYRCRQLVDCTGDGDLATMAGAPFEKSPRSQRQPMTMTFIMSQVDLQRTVAAGHAERLPHEVAEGGSAWYRPGFGSYDVSLRAWEEEIRDAFPEHASIITQVNIKDLCDGVYHGGNMVHIPGLDGSDTVELSEAEASGRRIVFRLGQFVRQHVPGFENAHLVNTSARIGVRETRRIVGEHVLDYDDVVEARRFDDVVALGGYRVDIHGYDGGAKYVEPERGTQIRDFGCYDIPFRCLVPQRVENVVVAGRSISATHVAQGSVRVMGTSMAMGQAAGTAAAIAAERDQNVREVDVARLQRALRADHAKLAPSAPA